MEPEVRSRLAAPAGDPAARRRQVLRRFGVTVGIACAAIAVLLLWKHRALWPACAGLAGLLLVLAWLAPRLLDPLERVWMKAAGLMGWLMTRVILGIVFVLIFTPAGLMLRLLGKDPLELRFRRDAASYWHMRPPRDPARERMEKMF